jgi:hypothetical protein
MMSPINVLCALTPAQLNCSLSDRAALVDIDSKPNGLLGRNPQIAFVLRGREGGSEDIIRRTQCARKPVDFGRGLL